MTLKNSYTCGFRLDFSWSHICLFFSLPLETTGKLSDPYINPEPRISLGKGGVVTFQALLGTAGRCELFWPISGVVV